MIQPDIIPDDVDAVIVNPDETEEALELVDDETSVLIETDREDFKAVYADVAPSYAEYKVLIYQKVVDLRAAPDDMVISERGQAYPWEERNP